MLNIINRAFSITKQVLKAIAVLLTTSAAAVSVSAVFFPDATSKAVPGLSGIIDRFDRLLSVTEGIEREASQGKREYSDDPVTQLANWGYPLGQFENGQALFLKALRDGRQEVLETALKANIRLDPEILAIHPMPSSVWPALVRHENWKLGLSLCEAIEEEPFDTAKLEEKFPETYDQLDDACRSELRGARRSQDRVKRDQEDELEAQREKKARNDARIARLREEDAKRKQAAIRRCEAFFGSDQFFMQVKDTLAKYILDKGQYWNGLPKYNDPEGVYLKAEYNPDIDALISYTAANFGVLDGKLLPIVPYKSGSRFKSVDHAVRSHISRMAEFSCR